MNSRVRIAVIYLTAFSGPLALLLAATFAG